jgi:hypothetical protein
MFLLYSSPATNLEPNKIKGEAYFSYGAIYCRPRGVAVLRPGYPCFTYQYQNIQGVHLAGLLDVQNILLAVTGVFGKLKAIHLMIT